MIYFGVSEWIVRVIVSSRSLFNLYLQNSTCLALVFEIARATQTARNQLSYGVQQVINRRHAGLLTVAPISEDEHSKLE